MTIFHYIFFAVWFFLPAGIANMIPIFSAKIPRLRKFDFPMDFRKTFRGKRIFGDHKTIRGLISGIIVATIVLWLQQIAVQNSIWLQNWTLQVDYEQMNTFIVGPLFALGALLGDAIESFFKRQAGIKPGDGWFPFDQTDYIIGGSIATWPFVPLSFIQYIWLVVIWFGLHLISSYIGYLIHLKDKPI